MSNQIEVFQITREAVEDKEQLPKWLRMNPKGLDITLATDGGIVYIIVDHRYDYVADFGDYVLFDGSNTLYIIQGIVWDKIKEYYMSQFSDSSQNIGTKKR